MRPKPHSRETPKDRQYFYAAIKCPKAHKFASPCDREPRRNFPRQSLRLIWVHFMLGTQTTAALLWKLCSGASKVLARGNEEYPLASRSWHSNCGCLWRTFKTVALVSHPLFQKIADPPRNQYKAHRFAMITHKRTHATRAGKENALLQTRVNSRLAFLHAHAKTVWFQSFECTRIFFSRNSPWPTTQAQARPM